VDLACAPGLEAACAFQAMHEADAGPVSGSQDEEMIELGMTEPETSDEALADLQ